MPIYDTNHLEYNISVGHITIVGDNGRQLPAYWAHPSYGNKFPGIILIHDWWGLSDLIRRLAHFFAQMGYYVIVPDLFAGQLPATPQQALKLVEKYKPHGYKMINDALEVLESHHQCNRDVAAIGIGMGGSLAFESAIKRYDLEASIAFGGFPQEYLGQFHRARAPILAFYGDKEPYTKLSVIHSLKQELAMTPLKDKHEVHILPGIAHEFFSDALSPAQREQGRRAINMSLAFLEKYLVRLRGRSKRDEDII